MKICPNCNANNPDDSLFCINCGTSIASVAPVAEQNYAVNANQMPPAQQPPKKNKKGLIVALIIVAVLIVGAIGTGIAFFLLKTDNTEPVIDDEVVEEETDEITTAEDVPDDEETTETPDNNDNNKEESSVSAVLGSVEQKIADYVENNRDEIIAGFNQGFGTTSELTCTVSVYAEGRGIVVTACINEYDNLSDEVKNNIQSVYDGMGDVFGSSLDMIQVELPEVEFLKINVCEKDGDIIAVVMAQDEPTVDTV